MRLEHLLSGDGCPIIRISFFENKEVNAEAFVFPTASCSLCLFNNGNRQELGVFDESLLRMNSPIAQLVRAPH